jgi:hypothetical protein
VIIVRIQCPCCGYYTIDSDYEVIVDICEVCFWQYDEVAHDRPETMKGANSVTLNQARKNYKEFGACEQRFIDKVREPFPEELPENNQ